LKFKLGELCGHVGHYAACRGNSLPNLEDCPVHRTVTYWELRYQILY